TEQRWHNRTLCAAGGGDRLYWVALTTYNATLGGIVGGNFDSGKLYHLSRTYPTDDGVTINRVRTTGPIYAQGNRLRYSGLRLDTNTAVGLLSHSDDGGVTYTTPRVRDRGNARYSEWWRLGSAASDRVYRLNINDDTQPIVIAS